MQNAERYTNTLEEVDLVEIMTGKTDDPFVPHENILSKYSAMVGVIIITIKAQTILDILIGVFHSYQQQSSLCIPRNVEN